MNRSTLTRIGQAMADATKSLVGLVDGTAEVCLHTQTKAGVWATHHRNAGGLHLIQFGGECIEHQLLPAGQQTDRASKDRMALNVGTAYGRTPSGRLAWVVAHEFAHLLVSVAGKRLYREQHGPAFYEALGGLVGDGVVELIEDELLARLPDLRLDVEPEAPEPAPSPSVAAPVFKPGERVVFFSTRLRKVVRARVARQNAKSLTLVDESGGRWRASAHILLREGEEEALELQAQSATRRYFPGQRVSFTSRNGAQVAGRVVRHNRHTVTIVDDLRQKHRVAPSLLQIS